MSSGENKAVLSNLLPELKDFNFGIVLISIYFIFEFGSFQGLFPIIGELKLPFIVSLLTVLYAIYLVISKQVPLSSDVSRKFLILCLFIIIYGIAVTRPEFVKWDLVNLLVLYISQYVIIVTCVKRSSQFILLIDIWLGSILFSSFNGIMQGGLIWGNRWLNDENHISLVVATAIPFALIFYMLSTSRMKRVFYLLCLAFFVAVNIVAASRGGALAMMIVSFLCWLLMKNKLRYLIILSVAAVLVVSYAPQKFFDEMETLEQGTEEGTADDRIYLWGVAIDMFVDKPILGVGPMNYPVYFSDYEKGMRYPLGQYRVAHSTPVQWLAEMGLLGTILLLSLQKALFRNWRLISRIGKQRKNEMPAFENVLYVNVSHAVIISQIGFWFAAMFLTLMPFPFYWCLVPFSESWKNISLQGMDEVASRKGERFAQ